MNNKSGSEEGIRLIKGYGEIQPRSDFQYVPIHHFDASGASKVLDLYWAYGPSVYFVSLLVDHNRTPSVKYDPSNDRLRGSFFVVIPGGSLSEKLVEYVLGRISSLMEDSVDLSSSCVIYNGDISRDL